MKYYHFLGNCIICFLFSRIFRIRCLRQKGVSGNRTGRWCTQGPKDQWQASRPIFKAAQAQHSSKSPQKLLFFCGLIEVLLWLTALHALMKKILIFLLISMKFRTFSQNQIIILRLVVHLTRQIFSVGSVAPWTFRPPTYIKKPKQCQNQ